MSSTQYNLYKRNKIEILQFTFGPFQENTYVIFLKDQSQCLIIDPGMSNAMEEKIFEETLNYFQLVPTQIFNTHCHIDHIMGVAFLQKKYNLPFYHHPKEESNIARSEQMSLLWNIPYSSPLEKGSSLMGGDVFSIEDQSFDIIEVPGHSEGHLAFIQKESGIILSGDVLFRESIGRTDLPGGSMDILEQSVQQLYLLPDDYEIFCGHGPNTTIGHEKRMNPFFRSH
jgi:hydroxyacylglutathione hydrolase